MVDVHPDFISFLPETAYTIVNATPISTSTPTEKTLDRMNWIELANKALEMNLIESIQKAQEQKLTKAQLIDIINGVNA